MPDLPVIMLRPGDRILNEDGSVNEVFRNAWNVLVNRTGGESTNALLGVINGQTQLSEQQAADRANSISRDAALAGAGDGTGTSDADIFHGQASNGATWVTLVTNTVTPTGAGNYRFTSGDGGVLMADLAVGGVSDAGTFEGNWRIRESDGITPVIVDAGTFTVTYFPAEIIGYELGVPIIVDAHIEVAFTGLPAVTDDFANTYDSAPTDLTFEIQRASGSNDITGLTGSMKTAWA